MEVDYNMVKFECRICGRKSVNKLVVTQCESIHAKNSKMSVEKILEENELLYEKNKKVIQAFKKK